MKQARTWQRRILWVEELEPRLVLSTLPAPVQSTNWSGYAAQTSFSSPAANVVGAVYGGWTVPALAAAKGTAYTSVWVGIDGYSSNTVEQIGTDSDLVNGVPTYYAWYEMYPNGSVNIPAYNANTKTGITVNANDAITASVTYSGNTFALTITDTSSNESYSPPAQTVKSAQRSSAEWIVEAPSSNQGVLPLANFGSVNFTGASATINGTRSSIDGYNAANPAQPLWQSTAINMITSRGAVQAATGALTDTTTTPVTSSFSVAYAGTTAPTPTPPPSPHQHWGWGWGSSWRANNEGVQYDSGAPLLMSATSTAQLSAAFASGPQGAANFSAVAPPVGVPANASSGLWMSLTGPAASSPDDDGDDDAAMFGGSAMAPPFADLVHPTALALATATPIAAADAAPPQSVVEQARSNVVLVAEAPATAGAPPASQPEPHGNVVTKMFSKAFWVVSALAFVSHTAFMRGKRKTGRNQNGNEREDS